MKNAEIARIIRDIGIFEDMKGEQFKPRAYEKAAEAIESLDEELTDVYRRGGIKSLMEIPGIGHSIAEKIEEALKTGKVSYYEKLRKHIPVDIDRLSSIEGVGPKTIKTLYQKLKIRTVEELEKAARSGRVRKLKGFGEKKEQGILKSIEFFRRSGGRFVLGFVYPVIKEIEGKLQKLPEVRKAVVAGSVRRMKETIGDADILVVSDRPQKVMDYFTRMPEVVDVIGKGDTKSSVKLKTGLNVDIRVVPEKSFGAALQYFTGNKDHNVELRRIAISKGLKLSEYGLFDRKNRQVAGETEEGVYEKLGMRWMPPELREDTGEIEAAAKNKLPDLIGYGDLKGDLQVTSNWTDGNNSIQEMAEEAKRMGLEYISMADHTKSLAMTHGLDEKGLLKQMAEIDRINKRLDGMTVLKCAEVNILKDGKLDISDRVLSQLEVVGIAVHTNFRMGKVEMTKRITAAMENENADVLYHPTGRIIQKREPYEVDVEKIIDVAKSTGTILEIDAFPDRLDLKDEYVRKAVQAGVKLSIDSDAHNKTHFKFLQFGIAQARRGWAERKDVVNTSALKEFLKFLKH